MRSLPLPLPKLYVVLALAFLAGLFATPTTAHAQDSSSITGVVTDATDAVIPDATVTLTNKTTGFKQSATTSSSGVYHFLNVPPGSGYQESFTHPGFSVVNINDIYLAVGDVRTQNAKLGAGVSTEVNVSAAASNVTLNTTDATIGSNVDVSSLNQLPVQDRTAGITTLFNLEPGVVNTQLDSTNSTQSGSVTGARTDQTSVTVDGLDVNDIAAGTTFGIIATAPVDSVEQFTGTVGGLTPNLGTGSGGQFQLVTKHGTNAFHGNVNEYHRDTSTASNTYFNNNVGLARTPLIRNQFGGNIGGPIVRDKLFFFFDFADSRIIQSNAAEPTVPIPALYSSNPTLNYINNNDGCGDTSRLNNAPNCISSINAAQAAALDPAGIGFNPNVLAFLAKRYPAPNDPTQGDGVNTEGLRFTYPQPDFETTYVGRIDYNLTQKNKIYGRFTINRTNEVYPTGTGAPEFPGDPASLTEVDRSYGYVVSDIWTIGNNKVNQFYYGDNISKLTFAAGDFTTSPNVFSFSGLSNPYGTYNTQSRRIPIPVVRDDFNWQIGNHGLTMGGLFKFIKTNSNNITNFNFVAVGEAGATLGGGLSPALRPANINQNSQVALNDYDEIYLSSLGVIGDISTNFDYGSSGNVQTPGAGNPYAYRYYQTELYAGDTWKVSKQLTLSYGLRWQTNSVPYEVHGKQSNYQLQGLTQPQSTFNEYFGQRLALNASGALNQTLPYFQAVLGGKANHAAPSYSQIYTDFAPRVAFAYNPSSLPKTVFNGSAALVYDRTVINAINNLQSQLSFLFENSATNQLGDLSNPDERLGANLSYDSSLAPVAAPIASGYIPFVDPNYGPYGLAYGEEGFDIDPKLKDPYSISLNAGVQQELPWHMVLNINYVGRLGRRLLADADASQILNFPDNASGQTLSQAFANLTGELRSGAAITPQPWIEDVVGYSAVNNPNSVGGPCTSAAWPVALYGSNTTVQPFANCTQLVAATFGQYGPRGDLGDGIPFGLAQYGLLPNNVAMPSQFAANGFLTNKGFSSYNALLVSLSKNLSQGLRFDFNYTFSHSIDNNSQAANNNALFNSTGIICDVTQPRACRGNSDFDVRQIISADVQYALPFGHNQRFGGGVNTFTNELIGGWSISALPSFRTGLPINVLSDAFISSFAAEDPAIFTGNHADLGLLRSKPNNYQGTVYNFPNGPTGASAAYALFRGPLGLEYGSRNLLHGPIATNLDAGLSKIFPVFPRKGVNLTFRADFFNILNHPNFANPAGSVPDIVNNTSPFGQITSTISPSGQVGDIRVGQFALRLDF